MSAAFAVPSFDCPGLCPGLPLAAFGHLWSHFFPCKSRSSRHFHPCSSFVSLFCYIRYPSLIPPSLLYSLLLPPSQMDSAILLQFAQHPSPAPHNHPSHHFPNPHQVYHPVMPQSSFLRSSASRPSMQQDTTHYVPYGTFVDSLPSSDSPSSSASDSAPRSLSNGATYQTFQDYLPKSDYEVAPSSTRQSFSGDMLTRQPSWGLEKQPMPVSEYYTTTTSYETRNPAISPPADVTMLQQQQQYVQPEDSAYPPPLTDFPLSSFYESNAPEPPLAAYADISGHTTAPRYPLPSNVAPAGPPPSVSFGFPHQVQSQTMVHNGNDMQSASYALATHQQQEYPHSPSLQYPPSSPDSPPQFVNLAQVSPSPTISPQVIFNAIELPPSPPQYPLNSSPGMNGVGSPCSTAEYENRCGVAAYATTSATGLDGAPRRRGRAATIGGPVRKRQRQASFTSSSDGSIAISFGGDSGESEKEDDEEGEEEGDDDDEFVLRSSSRPRRRTGRSQSADQATSLSYTPTGSRRLAAPIPVPNLTKKSRGRRVPTAPVIISQNGVQKVCWLSHHNMSEAYSFSHRLL